METHMFLTAKFVCACSHTNVRIHASIWIIAKPPYFSNHHTVCGRPFVSNYGIWGKDCARKQTIPTRVHWQLNTTQLCFV